MNKTLITIALCALNCLMAVAQNNTAEMECHYRLCFRKDTTTTAYTFDLMVLRLNKEMSMFYSYNSYRFDSLLFCSEQSDAMQMDILANGAGRYPKGAVSYNLIKNFKKNQIDYSDNIGSEFYRYKEPIPTLDWKITGEQKKIWDYTCQKAVCDFRGRTYEAWFTTEIPVSNGPWKLQGLPGLILEAYDTQKHYAFEFAGLQKSEASIGLLPHEYIETTREKYQKAYMNFEKDPIGFLSASMGVSITPVGGGRTAKKPKNIKYDMMERDR